MKNVVIISESEKVTPSLVQDAIKNRFAFSKNKEVTVKYDAESLCFDVYQDDKYLCSYDENGNKI